MARTAPTYAPGTGSPAYVHVAFRMIDASGDLRTVSHDLDPTDATEAKIEAMAAGLSAITNADLYGIEVTEVWSAVPDSSNAVDAVKDSVFDNLVIQLKNASNQSARGFIPAPEGGLFITNTDQIDPTNTDLITYMTALTALYAAGSYSITGARYTERREINEQVKF